MLCYWWLKKFQELQSFSLYVIIIPFRLFHCFSFHFFFFFFEIHQSFSLDLQVKVLKVFRNTRSCKSKTNTSFIFVKWLFFSLSLYTCFWLCIWMNHVSCVHVAYIHWSAYETGWDWKGRNRAFFLSSILCKCIVCTFL